MSYCSSALRPADVLSVQSSASSQEEAGVSPEEWFVLILLFNQISDDTGEISREAGKQFLADMSNTHQPAAF